MKTKIKWWLEEILEKRWIRIILGILTIAYVILYISIWSGYVPAIFTNNEIGRWVIFIVAIAPVVCLAIGGISVLIKGIIEGFKAETSPISKGILICSLVSLTIGLYELYWFLFKGSELGLVLAVLSFVVSYICFYLWGKK